jgi:hypothetical protein
VRRDDDEACDAVVERSLAELLDVEDRPQLAHHPGIADSIRSVRSSKYR